MEEYHRLLKEKYPSKEDVLTEIINLKAICMLPKGTEHFVSDLHGEFQGFNHVLCTGSGSIREKIYECFPNYSVERSSSLGKLIYYPEERIQIEIEQKNKDEFDLWCLSHIIDLIQLTKFIGRKYTRSKVRKALPSNFRYILEELMVEENPNVDKKKYFDKIITELFEFNQEKKLIVALSNTIKELAVDHLHVVGDIYDRGPYPDKIIEKLMEEKSVDIQWGNHDIIWMAAIAGSPISIMNIIRISARYENIDVLEKSYGISLRPMIEYANKYYTPLDAFNSKSLSGSNTQSKEKEMANCLQQASAILQFKLESQMIARRPEFMMEHRDVLRFINYKEKTILLNNKEYSLVDFNAPTVNPDSPSMLTDEEDKLIKTMISMFQSSEKLQRHIRFILKKGQIYLKYNNNLLIHGCIPLEENGDFKTFKIDNKDYSGKKLFDFFNDAVRKSFLDPNNYNDLETDLLWYLWAGECSPLFGKKAMATFERYYIKNPRTHFEKKNAYFALRNDEGIVNKILEEFHINSKGHIINGHTPVKEKDGECPIKAAGKLIIIDGGFSKPYQDKTGIAGYTLIYNSYGMQLFTHRPFDGIDSILSETKDIVETKRNVDNSKHRILVKDTNIGNDLIKRIEQLTILFNNYDQL